jgi:hypothetical protein
MSATGRLINVNEMVNVRKRYNALPMALGLGLLGGATTLSDRRDTLLGEGSTSNTAKQGAKEKRSRRPWQRRRNQIEERTLTIEGGDA